MTPLAKLIAAHLREAGWQRRGGSWIERADRRRRRGTGYTLLAAAQRQMEIERSAERTGTAEDALAESSAAPGEDQRG